MLPCIDNFVAQILKSIAIVPNQKKVYNVLHDTEVLIGEIMVKTLFSFGPIKNKVGEKSLSVALTEFSRTMFIRSI